MEEHEDLQARLRATGANPVDPKVAADHLTRMADVRPRSTIRPKLAVAAAFLAGLLLGGSGLAAAGALPDPVQHIAHQAFDPLGVDVPDPERYHGPECGGEAKKNHGAYVRDDHDLAKSRCGKPVKAGGSEADEEKGPCQGPPPWAGKDKGNMTAAEKAAAQAAREEACGAEDADDAEAGARDSATEDSTTTTVAPTTTTTVDEGTTTTVDEGTTTTTTEGTGDTDAGGS